MENRLASSVRYICVFWKEKSQVMLFVALSIVIPHFRVRNKLALTPHSDNLTTWQNDWWLCEPCRSLVSLILDFPDCQIIDCVFSSCPLAFSLHSVHSLHSSFSYPLSTCLFFPSVSRLPCSFRLFVFRGLFRPFHFPSRHFTRNALSFTFSSLPLLLAYTFRNFVILQSAICYIVSFSAKSFQLCHCL